MQSVLADQISLSSTFSPNGEKKFSSWQQAFVRLIPENEQDPRHPLNSSYTRNDIIDCLALNQTPLTWRENWVLLTLLSHQTSDGKLNPTNETLAQNIKASITTVRRTLRLLTQANIIICKHYYPMNGIGLITTKRRQISINWNLVMKGRQA